VSSVGKVQLPASASAADGDDDDADVPTPEFRQLLDTITRTEVDKYTTRCPHAETSERMTQVRLFG
jgi:chorismate synthase